MNLHSILQLCRKRRWALFFLNLTAGVFAAPYLYWTCILMRVVLRAARDEPVLPWLGAIDALGGLLLVMLAMWGAGGCLSALRKILRGEDGFIPGEVFGGLRRCAKTSVLVGAILGVSLMATRVGLLNLHTFSPSGAVRITASAFLLMQLAASLPLCMLALTREDALQSRPSRALAAAGRIYVQSPARMLGLSAATALPLLLFFVCPPPLLTLLGFLVVALCGLVPVMLAWQTQAAECRGGVPAARLKPFLTIILIFFALDALILFLPLLQRTPDPQAALRNALDFVSRLYADSGTLLRDLLAASSVWPLLLAALLGSMCCVMAAYACACYKFHARRMVFLAAVLLQVLPMLASYSSLEQLLRNLELPITGTLLGFCWALAYLLVALLLYRRFARMLPSLQKNREKFPGARLFFYYALPRAPLHILALAALATLGCWDDALAPFWYMRRLGAFTLIGYIWENLSGWGELALYIAAFLAILGLFVIIVKLRLSPPKPRLPRPSAD